MEFFNIIYSYVLPFLVILTVLVFVHEMGHYLIARYNGVKIEVFSIGFGPEIFGWNDKTGTRWKFSAIPLGGYVKMFGDANAASMPDGELPEMTEADKAVAFHHKRLSQRAWIVVGGPLANYVFAILVFAVLFGTIGEPFTPAVVGDILEDSPAERAGFVADDRFVTINGSAIESFSDIQRVVSVSAGKPLAVVVLRDGAEMALEVTPERVVATDAFGNEQEIGRLGIQQNSGEFIEHSPLSAVWVATKETVFVTGQILRGVYEIVTGQRSVRELGGPLKIAQMSGQAAEVGLVFTVWFMAILSVNLGLINLFPIPMLDGGHLLFYCIEWLRGRPLGERAQEYGFRIGLGLVMSLVLLVTWNDLVSIRVIDFVKSLMG